MIIYQSKSYLWTKLKNYKILVTLLIICLISIKIGLGLLVFWICLTLALNQRIIVTTEELIFKNVTFNHKIKFQLDDVKRIRINKRGFNIVGGTPFVELKFCDNYIKRVAIYWFDDEDYKTLNDTLKQCLGEENVDIFE